MTVQEQLDQNITIVHPCGCRYVPDHLNHAVAVYKCDHCTAAGRREMQDLQRRRYGAAGLSYPRA